MIRIPMAALVLVLSAAASADPTPPDDRDAARMQQDYGVPVDPDRDCRFSLALDRLTIGVPGSLHALARSPVNMNAPRVLREVSGDFTATVRVAFLPTERPAVDGAGPMSAGGGLVALSDGDNFAAATRTQEYIDQRLWVSARSLNTSRDTLRNATQTARRDIEGASPEAFYLRIQRKDKLVTACAGPDGKEWIEVDHYEVAWGLTVSVGVVVENRSASAFEVEFAEFSLTSRN